MPSTQRPQKPLAPARTPDGSPPAQTEVENAVPTGGGFGATGPTAHVPGDARDVAEGEAQLDDALRETFPASDPISPGAAATEQALETPPDVTTSSPAASSAPIPFPTSESVATPKGSDAGPQRAASRGPRRRT